MIRDFRELTVADCIFMYTFKNECAIVSNGQVVLFEKERGNENE